MCVCTRVCVCVCACVRACVRERESVCIYIYIYNIYTHLYCRSEEYHELCEIFIVLWCILSSDHVACDPVTCKIKDIK